MSNSKPTCGRFVWFELFTTDKNKAKDFYTQLMGWTIDVDEKMGGYTMFKRGEEHLGGLESLDPSQNASSHWLAYVSVPDLDQAVSPVEAMGGKMVKGVTPIPGVGRFAIIRDPAGAVLAPFETRAPQTPKEAEWRPPSGPGTFCWNEVAVPAPALEKTGMFYQKMFGWATYTAPMEGMGDYRMYKAGDKDVAGMWELPEQAGFPPHWMHYLHVEDVDGTTAKARQLGAEVIKPPADIPNIGRFSIIKDPTGGVVSLFQGLGA